MSSEKQKQQLFAQLGLPEEKQGARQQTTPSADTREAEDRQRVREAAARYERERGVHTGLVLIVYEYRCTGCGTFNYAPGSDGPLAEYRRPRGTRHLKAATASELRAPSVRRLTEIRKRTTSVCVGCWEGEQVSEPPPPLGGRKPLPAWDLEELDAALGQTASDIEEEDENE